MKIVGSERLAQLQCHQRRFAAMKADNQDRKR